jgi:hypothetical protein
VAKEKSFITLTPGLFTIVKCGASGHNVRSHPSMSAAPIGMLNLGDTFLVAQVKETNGEIWVQLDQVSVFCPKMTATNALAYFDPSVDEKDF